MNIMYFFFIKMADVMTRANVVDFYTNMYFTTNPKMSETRKSLQVLTSL